jgi:hypothetical protein
MRRRWYGPDDQQVVVDVRARPHRGIGAIVAVVTVATLRQQ